jgi:hypothetical protein
LLTAFRGKSALKAIATLWQRSEARKCDFRNLLESGKGRWGEGLTAEDMKRCRWLKQPATLEINALEQVTKAVVEAARESLVIGQA